MKNWKNNLGADAYNQPKIRKLKNWIREEISKEEYEKNKWEEVK